MKIALFLNVIYDEIMKSCRNPLKAIMKKAAVAALLTLLSAFSVIAQDAMFEKNYIVVAPQYNDVDLDGADSSEAGFTLAFGTEVHPQWYAEVGYSFLADDYEPGRLLAGDENQSAGVSASGLYLAFLGKAANQSGELFYKLGVMTIDYEGGFLASDSQSCNGDSAVLTLVDSGQSVIECVLDETSFAGIVGAGFDFHVGYSSQVRLNVEHIRGADDFQSNSVQLGYRYNF